MMPFESAQSAYSADSFVVIPPHLLERIPLLADGVPGDWLAAQHKGLGGSAESVNLRRPEWVQAGHDAFYKAGARALRTNTAQANAVTLATQELGERCEAINNSAMALLRAAVGQQALAMGALGPIRADVPLPDRERAYSQQVVYLCDTGSDFILLDGFGDTMEALLVRRLALSAGDAPVLALLHADATGLTQDGRPLADAMQQLGDAGCDAVGALFTVGAAPLDLQPLVEPMLGLDLPTAVFLGAATPGALSPEDYAARLAPLARLRTVVLGGGRHIGPAHVAALAQRVTPTERSA